MSSTKSPIREFFTRPPKDYKPNPQRGKTFNALYGVFWGKIRPQYRKIRKGTIERSQKTAAFTRTNRTLSLSIPIIAFAFYTLLVQAPQYEAITTVLVENKAGGSQETTPLAMLTGVGNNLKDLHLIVDYVQSYTMLQKLDNNLQLHNRYKKIHGIDFASPIWFNSIKNFLRVYRNKVTLEINEDAGTLIVKYRDYTAFQAFEVLREIITLAEGFLNEINREVLKKEIGFYEKELENIMVEIRKMKHFLTSKQVETKQLSPTKTFEAIAASIMEVEARLLQEKAKLAELSSYLSPSSLQIQAVKTSIATLEGQVSTFKENLAKQEHIQDGDDKNSSISFTTAEMELMLLMEKYKMVLQALEQHKFNAIHNAKHLVEISKPYEPDEPTYPKRLINIIIFALLYGVGIFIVRVILEVIHEHKFY